MKFKKLSIMSILCLFAGIVFGQSYEKSSYTEKIFPFGKEASLQINSKYGQIHMIPWEKDSVKIQISLKVTANKENKVDKLFKSVDFNFTNTSYYLIIETVFRNSRNNLWENLSDMANNLLKANDNIQIDYTIHFPNKRKVKIDHKYGNIYTTDHYGELDITLSNGDLMAGKLFNDSKIDLSFGKAIIKELYNSRIISNYGEINAEKAKDLNIQSKSSTIDLDEVSKVNINSRRDEIYISKVQRLSGEFSFSKIHTENLIYEAIINAYYGNVNLENHNDNLQLISLTGSYTDIKIVLPEQNTCNLEIIHTEKTSLDISKDLGELKQELIDKDEEKYRSVITSKDNKPSDSRVYIETKGGYINIKND